MLTHLSDGVSDERKFKQLTEAAFGIPTVVADKNTVIELWMQKPRRKNCMVNTTLFVKNLQRKFNAAYKPKMRISRVRIYHYFYR